MAKVPAVQRIVIFGSVARPEVLGDPHSRELRRRGYQVTRQCEDLDLAVWVSDLGCLKALQRARSVTPTEYYRATNYGIAQHMIDVFLMEPGTGRYLGRLCPFKDCPKQGKMECFVPGCGATQHLKQHLEFTLSPEALAPGVTVVLFERRRGKS
jgi:hypothetical protein